MRYVYLAFVLFCLNSVQHAQGAMIRGGIVGELKVKNASVVSVRMETEKNQAIVRLIKLPFTSPYYKGNSCGYGYVVTTEPTITTELPGPVHKPRHQVEELTLALDLGSESDRSYFQMFSQAVGNRSRVSASFDGTGTLMSAALKGCAGPMYPGYPTFPGNPEGPGAIPFPEGGPISKR